MSAPFQDYLKLLREVGRLMEQLAGLAQQKADVVRRDDLLGLDDVLKQEQALGLNLRGMELRRLKLVPQLGLEGVPLSGLTSKCPPELKDEARQVVGDLTDSYRIYRSSADMARNTLELNLHQIEKFVAANGGDPKDLDMSVGSGYAAPDKEPPRSMKTDFRA